MIGDDDVRRKTFGKINQQDLGKDTNHSIINSLLRQSLPQPLEHGSSVKKYINMFNEKNHVSMHLFNKNWINVSI